MTLMDLFKFRRNDLRISAKRGGQRTTLTSTRSDYIWSNFIIGCSLTFLLVA